MDSPLVYHDHPSFSVYWYEAEQCVCLERKPWSQGENYRRGLDIGLELLKKNRASRWLSNLRELKVVAQEDQKWINENWFPRAIAAGLRRMAIVVPASAIGQMSIVGIVQKVKDSRLEVQYFDDLNKAKQWLQQ